MSTTLQFTSLKNPAERQNPSAAERRLRDFESLYVRSWREMRARARGTASND